jgi:hypothetical protein
MIPVDVKTVAETIILGLEDNDEIQRADLIDPDKEGIAIIGIETDTGELFFAEVMPA